MLELMIELLRNMARQIPDCISWLRGEIDDMIAQLRHQLDELIRQDNVVLAVPGGPPQGPRGGPGNSGGGMPNRPRPSAPNSLVTHIPTAGRKFNQIARRGWTRTTINETVNNPFTTRAAINRANNNPATAFFNADGTHVIRDNITGELVQLSDRLNPSTWIPDSCIVNPFIP